MKKSTIAELEALYGLEIDRDELVPLELCERLAVLTGKINREIAVYINRKGSIIDVNIGDSSTVTLSEVEGRRGKSRLSGIRCIHTHPNGDGMLSPVDLNSLISLNLDAMIALGVKQGQILDVYVAIPSVNGDCGRGGTEIHGPYKLISAEEQQIVDKNDSSISTSGNITSAKIFSKSSLGAPAFAEKSEVIFPVLLNDIFKQIYELDNITPVVTETGRGTKEKAIIVGLELDYGKPVNGMSEGERSLEELLELSLTAGLEVMDKVLQRRPVKDAAFYIGRGKIEQLGLMCQALGASVLVFDDELAGAQIRNIEETTGAKVIDRTALILDIFAQRARSSEGKLQVELAQLKYRLPRLTGMGGQLSRLGGGIGTRGPGEKKLEVDRRHIRRRMSILENELKQVSKRRALLREGRSQNAIPVIALAGYTNSGKSTLMNALCHSDVFAEDKLFATLDPTTRKLMLPDGRSALLVDTVGFIKKLPHELVEAFKSTLEEVVYADILLHVADASDDEAEEKIIVAEGILRNLGAFNKPVILVLNKMDMVKEKSRLPFLNSGYPIAEISALTGEGLNMLLEDINRLIPSAEMEIALFAPYSTGWVLPYMYNNGKILAEEYTGEGVKIRAAIKRDKVEKVREFII